MEFNGTFFVTIISFLVFVFMMNKLLYEPVRKIVKERNDFISSNYSIAEENNTKADTLTKEHDEKIVTAKEDARTKYNELVNEFKEQKSEIVKDAQEKSRNEIEQAYAQINSISNETRESLKGRLNELASDIVEKVLGYRSDVHEFDNDSINSILYH